MMLGAMESHCRQALASAGRSMDKEWGGAPVALLVGDDYQLPSISYGAFHSVPRTDINVDSNLPAAAKTVRESGFEQFRLFSKNVMMLTSVKRVNDDQSELKVKQSGLCLFRSAI